MASSGVRNLLSVVMNVLVFVAIALTARVVVQFFGTVASKEWAETIVQLTSMITIPAGLDDYRTPYGGIFDMNGALSVILVLLGEWALSAIRSRG